MTKPVQKRKPAESARRVRRSCRQLSTNRPLTEWLPWQTSRPLRKVTLKICFPVSWREKTVATNKARPHRKGESTPMLHSLREPLECRLGCSRLDCSRLDCFHRQKPAWGGPRRRLLKHRPYKCGREAWGTSSFHYGDICPELKGQLGINLQVITVFMSNSVSSGFRGGLLH